jgi:hypothetical protein
MSPIWFTPSDLGTPTCAAIRSNSMTGSNLVGRAHARQMDAATRRAWKADLLKNRSKSLDAPSWLWRSTVDLLVSHERAYLEHCRNMRSTIPDPGKGSALEPRSAYAAASMPESSLSCSSCAI